jgi:hypothetical protein
LASRGNFWPVAGPSPLLGREPMAALLAARRQNFAAALGLHTHAKPVCLGAAAFPRLICTLWQSIPPCFFVESSAGPGKPHAPTLERRVPPVPTTCRVGFGVFSVKPGCHSSGNIRNLLVYLPPAHRVKKSRGYYTLRGNCYTGVRMALKIARGLVPTCLVSANQKGERISVIQQWRHSLDLPANSDSSVWLSLSVSIKCYGRKVLST